MPRTTSEIKNKKYKKNQPDSDSDSDSTYVSDSEIETPKSKKSPSKKSKKSFEDSDSDNSDDLAELHKTLQSLFPSKYMADKIKEEDVRAEAKAEAKAAAKAKAKAKAEKDKKKHSRSKKYESESEEEEAPRKKKHSKSKKYESESEEESVYEDIDDDDEETLYEDIDDDEEDIDIEYEDEDDDDDDDNVADDKNFKINITIGGNGPATKNKVQSNLSNDDYGSDDEKTFMKETFEQVGFPLTPSTSQQSLSESVISRKSEKEKEKKKAKDDASDTMSEVVDIGDKYNEIVELKKLLVEKLKSNPNNQIIRKALKQCEHSIVKLIKNARSKNAKLYEDMINYADNQEMADEFGYFKKKLSNKEQLKIMNDLNDINKFMYVEKPYRLSLLQSNMPPKFKAIAIQRLNQLSMMEPGEAEYFKLKNWVDNFMRIPFGIYKNLSININDGIDKCSDYVINAKKQLDTCVFGLNSAKMQIMQMVGQWISNPGSMGTAIAIHGPPGTGKTSLVKDGISKILGREFAFIALGGCGDSSFLEGHSYTYEGSTWGKIVQILTESKCMNPVIYFDELDKVSDTPRGQEIIGILTHLTDTSQNSQFHDKYFSEIDLDLSKCLFIFSYNDEKLVNPILKDRMYRIVTKGYDLKEKLTIARNYMLPKIREQVGFGPDDIVISDEVLSHIISNQAKGEEGVRNLKRTLEIIHTKLNLYRLVKADATGIFEKDMGLKVTFPYTLSRKDVDTLVKVEECMSLSVLNSMYM
jgi:ATP-dependent Lon protease